MNGVLPITQMSGYRIMWMLVMFDLPVVEKKERKEATQFRNSLLDLGFDMVQFSVYMRCCVSRERADALTKKVRQVLPSGGKVSILFFTDKQYANMINFYARKKKEPPATEQLALF
jgi:CRISPR-associated protein Cas2